MPMRAGATGAMRKNAVRTKMDKQDAAAQRQSMKELNAYMTKYDSSGNKSFERDEMRSIITDRKREITGDSSATVPEEVLDKVMKKYAGADGSIPHDALLKAVSNYESFLRNKVIIEEIFKAVDADKSGDLDKGQIEAFLKEVIRRKNEKLPQEKQYDKEVTEDDVAFVLERCDPDGTNTIDLQEAMEACAKWVDLLKDHRNNQKNGSSACVVL